MAFSKARRLSDFIAADGSIPTGKFASSTITSAHLVDGTVAHADLHTNMDLTGKTVLVSTQSASDNDTSAASTAYVTTAIANLVDSAPGTMNTLNEIAAALNDDANFNTTVTNAIAAKLPLAGGTLTGDLVISSANSPKITITDTTNTTTMLMYSQDGDSIIGTYSNHPLKLFSNSGLGLTLDTSQNATFAGDVQATGLYVGSTNTSYDFYNNGTSYFNGAVTVDDNITVSGGGGIVSGGDLTMDITGELIIDTDLQGSGNGILLKDGGTLYGSIFRSSSHLHIKAEAQDKNLLFLTNNGGSELTAMTIDSSGNVGVGVTPDTFSSGYTAIQINGYAYNIGHSGGDHYLTNNAYFNSGWKYGQTSTAQLIQMASGKITLFTAASGSADAAITWNTGLVQDASGHVGIGETSPDKQLHIKDTGAVGIAIESTDNAQNLDIDFYNNVGSAQGRIRYAEGAGSFGFAPNVSATDALHILYDGKVGIGSTAPAKPLHVKRTSGWATARLEGASDSGGEIEFYAGSTKKAVLWADNSTGSLVFRAGGSNTTAQLRGDGNWVGPHEDNVKRNFVGRGPFNVFDFSDEWHEFYNPQANTEHSISGSFTNAMGVIMTFPSNVTKKILQHARTPTGTIGVIYEAVPDTNNTWNGGWNSGQFRTDPDKGYIFGYYCKRITSASDGTHYAGFSHGVSAGTGSTVDSNPYFQAFANSNLPIGVWTLHYYHLHPRYYSGTGDGGIGGVYRCDTGARILGQTAWKQPVNQTYQVFRSYNYYSANTSVAMQWYAPFVYEVNGHEPTPAALLVNT